MESRWHTRGHALHESAASPSPVVLPSVAQLIASSLTPSTGSIPAYHHPNSSLPPIQGSTPHSPPAIAPSANPPSPPEHLHQRHTTCASPTGSASSMSERSSHHQSSAQYQPPQGVTFHGSHPEADAHRPTNARRQDSAISHPLRPDTAKEVSSLVRPSEPDLSSSHRSPNSSHHSTAATSPGHVLSHSSAPAPPANSHEHVTLSLNSSHMHPAPGHSYSTQSLPFADPSHTTTTRLPRFNVRFATNHTPENMPSAQRPRHNSPPSVTVPPPEPVEEVASPKAEPVRPAVKDRQLINILFGHRNESAEPSPDTHEGPERCSGCNEAWKPMEMKLSIPLKAADIEGGGFEEQHVKMIRAMEANRENLRQYDKANDEAFDQWKKRHSQCPIVPTAPPQDSSIAGPSNKRKSEGPHGDVSKRRGVANGHAVAAPSVQSSTSA